MSLDYNKRNITLAKNLRKSATPQENHLWYDFLSKYKVRFQRQKAIGDFIADFYCHSARLIIELDGSQHYTSRGKARDEARTEILEKYGIYVLRFSNKDVDDYFEDVCRMIDRVINERIESPL